MATDIALLPAPDGSSNLLQRLRDSAQKSSPESAPLDVQPSLTLPPALKPLGDTSSHSAPSVEDRLVDLLAQQMAGAGAFGGIQPPILATPVDAVAGDNGGGVNVGGIVVLLLLAGGGFVVYRMVRRKRDAD